MYITGVCVIISSKVGDIDSGVSVVLCEIRAEFTMMKVVGVDLVHYDCAFRKA
jgi:hypothetical protein